MVTKGAPALFSNSQLDKLGSRLRSDKLSAEDLRLLDEYRRSFSKDYEQVVSIIRDELLLAPTGRPAKSTTSIRDKLKRESIRLSQIQDIAGCRIVVPDIFAQDRSVNALITQFGDMKIFDRRKRPSHGYRAVHLIAVVGDRPVEIQVRSVFQHMWAELSEKAADIIDPALKYGGGPEDWQAELSELSDIVAERERFQVEVQELKTRTHALPDASSEIREKLRILEDRMAQANVELQDALKRLGAGITQ